MSGIASAASTTPGSVATFWSCSSDWSRSIACRSSLSAKTRAGTRMSGRVAAGISQSVSSIRVSSDIEYEFRTEAGARRGELETVVRHRLDEVSRAAGTPFDARAKRPLPEVQALDPRRDEPLRLGQEDEFFQPIGEKHRAVGSGELDLVWRRVPLAAAGDQLRERRESLGEDLLLALGLELEPELSGVVDEAVHEPPVKCYGSNTSIWTRRRV